MRILIKNIVVAVMFIVIFTSNFFLTGLKKDIIANANYQPTLIPEDTVGYFTFGYDNLIADKIWLEFVQYAGLHVFDKKDSSSYKFMKNIVALDPYFTYPYKMNMLIFGDKNSLEVIEISKKGIYYNPDVWEIPFNLAYIYSFILDEFSLGVAYFELASTLEGSPRVSKYLAQAIRRQNNQLESPLYFWQTILETSDNKKDKEKAILEIKRIKNMIFLRDAVHIFKSKYNDDPDFYMLKLVKKNIIDKMPKDPLPSVGYGWYADEQVIKITIAENEVNN